MTIAIVQAIRTDHAGFIKEREDYLKHARRGNLPVSLKSMAYSLPWPVNIEDPYTHIMNFYVLNSDLKDGIKAGISEVHAGVDIQVKVKPTKFKSDVEVKPVQEGKVICCRRDTTFKKNLADVFVQVPNSKYCWGYVHLDLDSIPTKIKSMIKEPIDDVNFNSTVEVTPEDTLGVIGYWVQDFNRDFIISKEKYEEVFGMDPEYYEVKRSFKGTVPDDVEAFFGRELHHLHLCLEDSTVALLGDYGDGVNPKDEPWGINPLLLLKKLYAF